MFILLVKLMNFNPLLLFKLIIWLLTCYGFYGIISDDGTTSHDEPERTTTYNNSHRDSKKPFSLESWIHTDHKTEQSTDHEAHQKTVQHVRLCLSHYFSKLFDFFVELRGFIHMDYILLIFRLLNELFIRIVDRGKVRVWHDYLWMQNFQVN